MAKSVCFRQLLLASSLLAVACRPQPVSFPGDIPPDLNGVAQHLSRAAPAELNPLHLSVDAIPKNDPVTLRCILTNVSSQPVQVLERALPCVNWSTLQVRGLTTAGRFLPMRPIMGGGVSADPPPEITVAPGESVIRETPLNDGYALADDRDTDILLLWSYRRDQYVSTGVAFLPRHTP